MNENYDAIVLLETLIKHVCNESDISEEYPFTELVKDMIDSEGICGLIDHDTTKVLAIAPFRGEKSWMNVHEFDEIVQELQKAKERIVELETRNADLQELYEMFENAYFVDETITADGYGLRPTVSNLIKRASDAEAQVRELKKKLQWIPVTERFPEDGLKVLVLDDGELDFGRHYETGHPDEYDDFKEKPYWLMGAPYGEWFIIDGVRNHEYKRITHWANIPKISENVRGEQE